MRTAAVGRLAESYLQPAQLLPACESR